MDEEVKGIKEKRLIDKTQSHCHKKNGSDRHDIHDDVDIKEAIGWLKDEIHKSLSIKEYSDAEYIVLGIIDKAFVDII